MTEVLLDFLLKGIAMFASFLTIVAAMSAGCIDIVQTSRSARQPTKASAESGDAKRAGDIEQRSAAPVGDSSTSDAATSVQTDRVFRSTTVTPADGVVQRSGAALRSVETQSMKPEGGSENASPAQRSVRSMPEPQCG